MGPWSLFGAAIFGGVFALFAFWRVDSNALRVVIAAFLFGFYCAIVSFGTSGKTRSLSLAAQSLLGTALACTIAALFGASTEDYIAAVLIGLILGFTADWWVVHVQLP